ncbi:hypothetical protein [Photobacterium lutimaris]|uniref:Uncharacterized protein n=1 Tax=Photobacterium lutimaris TaxID=388278 RepID=A0A2T3J3Q2_9GAMM|nr:hypothetical protein [Photobacterium lutimaris]PSU35914.1 hypothetical protein C9I99_02520 [Photobacterium lutimaris]TDR78990.1 hypothetical protein DFP78_101504 [Photobacterium lutimaris]
MESLVVLLAAILWTAGRYCIHTPEQWQAKPWFIKGIAISLALFPAIFFSHWDELISSARFLSNNQIIACEISLRLFLIVMAIQSFIGLIFIVSSFKNKGQ